MSARHHLTVKDGVVLIGSDLHSWPGCGMSTAMRALVKFTNDMAPKAVIMNGDMMDFPQISRHPPIGHQKLPDLWEEIQSAQMLLRKVEKVAGRAHLVWPLGNHDARFETRLATVAGEFSRLPGHMLRNYFPEWEACWSCWINNQVVVKHRVNGGVHATHNNVIKTGMHTVTGHLHSAKVTAVTNYKNRALWGVDTGCLADVYGEPFTDYLEDGPRNWRAGFGVFTFKNHQLLQPELCLVWDEQHVEFRGKIIKV